MPAIWRAQRNGDYSQKIFVNVEQTEIEKRGKPRVRWPPNSVEADLKVNEGIKK